MGNGWTCRGKDFVESETEQMTTRVCEKRLRSGRQSGGMRQDQNKEGEREGEEGLKISIRRGKLQKRQREKETRVERKKVTMKGGKYWIKVGMRRYAGR